MEISKLERKFLSNIVYNKQRQVSLSQILDISGISQNNGREHSVAMKV